MAKKKTEEEQQVESTEALDPTTADEESGDEPKKSSGPTPIALAVSGIVAFVVFLGVFSFMLGVFDKDKAPENLSGTAHTDAADSTSDQHATQTDGHGGDAYTPYQPDTQVSFTFADAEPDTLEEITWIEEEKKKIKEAQLELAVDRRELESLKRQVESLLARKRQIETERIAYLAKLFDNMREEEVGKLMEQLDDDTIVSVLPRMKAASASRVLAMLPPKRAARITTMLLGLGQ